MYSTCTLVEFFCVNHIKNDIYPLLVSEQSQAYPSNPPSKGIDP